MMKKAIKIFLGLITLVVLALLILPVVFQDKIVTILKEKINENLNANVEFNDANLSLIKNFPNASLTLKDIAVTNHEPFKGDTLFYGQTIDLKLSLSDVIKGNTITIKSFSIDNAKVNVLVNKNGKANYDIAKNKNDDSEKKDPEHQENSKQIAIKSYAINNLDLVYHDKKSNMLVELKNFSHSGSGDLSSERTKLDTKTSTGLSFTMNNKSYADNMHLDLNALLDLDLKNQKFSFLKNEAHINQLPLVFDGFVKINTKNQEIDINFKTPSSDFKNFLALVPKQYAKNISDVKTTGNFSINGKVNGTIDDKHIPKIDVTIASNNASFKFPSLPKGVENIHLNTTIKNNTGLVENTFVAIQNISFKIDENTFSAKALIERLTTNALVDATLKGKLNLADIDKVYPLNMKNKLSGLINADLNTKFDAEAIQKSIPERIKNNGKISLNNFEFTSKDMLNPLSIKNAEVDFKPTTISLTNFEAKTGNTDLKATGTIYDLLGFVLSDKKLKGEFSLSSNNFKVLDFMQETPENTNTKTQKSTQKATTGELKIPSFLDITTKVSAKKVQYDNLELTNVSGAMIIKDQKAILKDIKASMFGGIIALNGSVNTKEKTPAFDMKMGIQNFNIASSFSSIKMLNKLAPIAKFIEGKFSTDINLDGKLSKDFTPDLSTIKGNAFAKVLNQGINPQNSKTMNLLSNNFKFIDVKKLNLKDIKTHLDFKDGKVNVKPFNIKYKDIKLNIGGSHGFDQNMNYKILLDVPAKYLGTEVTKLLTKVDAKNKNMIVPVTANLTGNFTHPSVKTDLKSAVTNLTSQLVKQQKNKLINNTLNKILPGSNSANGTKNNKTKEVIKKGVDDILGGFFGSKKKKKK